MSAVVKTITPFIDKDILIQSIINLGFKFCTNNQDYGVNPHTIPAKGFGKYAIPENEILIFEDGFYRRFTLENGRFMLQTDSHDPIHTTSFSSQQFKNRNKFLEIVEAEYLKLYNKKMEELEKQRQEEERIRLENERKAFVEKQKQTIITKAKEKGYSVKEEKVKGKIKLVLVRNTY